MSYRVSTLDRGAVHENRSQSEGAFVRSRLRGIGEAEGNLWRPQGEGRTAETPKNTAICSNCGQRCQGRYDQRTCRVRDLRVAGWVVYLEFERWRVRCSGCGGVHVERLDWLAQNPRYTERFALHVGRLCTSMSNKAVAELERLHDSTVKDLSKLYMQEQVRRAGRLRPRAIGIDEIAVRKGHDYRVVVSDLDQGRPIWMGGNGRTQADVEQFFAQLGSKASDGIELVVIDMWRPFRNAVRDKAPNAAIVFDKFHIMRHLSKSQGQVVDQGAALYAAVGTGEPDIGGTAGTQEAAGSQSAAEHGLPAEGVVWAAVELQNRARCQGVLRALETEPAMAAS